MNRLRPGRPAIGLAFAGLMIFSAHDAAALQNPAAPAVTGYLAAGELPDERIFLPPPPDDRSIDGRADMAVFRSTRALAGTPRWDIATRDAVVSTPALLANFSCPLGMALPSTQAPVLNRLAARAMRDVVSLVGLAKDRHDRARPFLRSKGATCVPASDFGKGRGSYPSGHAAAGWADALILAELAPARASQVLARGRAFGESRVVCGVHYPSDLDAGRTAAAAVLATLHANPEFQADMTAARAELSALLAGAGAAVDPKTCGVETATLSETPW